MRRNVVFTDRDGVINRNLPDFIKGPEEFDFLPGSCEALGRLTEKGFDVVVVTNQSALGRGVMTLESLEAIHRRMLAAMEAAGGRILDLLVCPHRPDDGCRCRKPAPGLLLAAQRKHRIDLSSAIMIGDSATDIECARNAGVGTALLVRTGNGAQAAAALAARGRLPDFIADDLHQAGEWIIERMSRWHAAP